MKAKKGHYEKEPGPTFAFTEVQSKAGLGGYLYTFQPCYYYVRVHGEYSGSMTGNIDAMDKTGTFELTRSTGVQGLMTELAEYEGGPWYGPYETITEQDAQVTYASNVEIRVR